MSRNYLAIPCIGICGALEYNGKKKIYTQFYWRNLVQRHIEMRPRALFDPICTFRGQLGEPGFNTWRARSMYYCMVEDFHHARPNSPEDYFPCILGLPIRKQSLF